MSENFFVYADRILLTILNREKLFYSIQYKNGCLVASDLSHMFKKSIKFYTFHYHISMLLLCLHLFCLFFGNVLVKR